MDDVNCGVNLLSFFRTLVFARLVEVYVVDFTPDLVSLGIVLLGVVFHFVDQLFCENCPVGTLLFY